MVREIEYINIREILSRILRNKLLQDYTLEQAVQDTLDFIGLFDFPELYLSKETTVDIKDYRGKLPCDLVKITMVKDSRTNIPLRKMTAVFNPGGKYYKHIKQEPQYKTQNRTIVTTFPKGEVIIAYKAIATDDEGYPLLIDNSKFLKALELYIKCRLFTEEFERGKIQQNVLQHTEQEYSWAAGQLSAEFKMPDISEMESISNIITQKVDRYDEFDNGFERLGNREKVIIH